MTGRNMWETWRSDLFVLRWKYSKVLMVHTMVCHSWLHWQWFRHEPWTVLGGLKPFAANDCGGAAYHLLSFWHHSESWTQVSKTSWFCAIVWDGIWVRTCFKNSHKPSETTIPLGFPSSQVFIHHACTNQGKPSSRGPAAAQPIVVDMVLLFIFFFFPCTFLL